ncbi:MAG: dihydropteroate synthase [Gemmatimonadota bacterium]|nr:dihydropteroate synthase [Gemmatimonadota bacterium]
MRGEALALGPDPLLMGIVNVTPDSFSDGGAWLAPERAVEHGLRLVEEGAAILDVGGESTRPGAEPVSAAAELDRVLPVVEALASGSGVPVSIDTTKRKVAEEALSAGAAIVNDVSALRFSPGIADLAAETGAGLVLMHMKGEPRTMQADPVYDDLLGEIASALEEAAGRARSAGVSAGSIVLDPGIGFGKTPGDNLRLIGRLDRLRAIGHPVLVGHSRKSFLDPEKRKNPAERLPESLAAGLLAADAGAAILRVHDVDAHARALEVRRRFRTANAEAPMESGEAVR